MKATSFRHGLELALLLGLATTSASAQDWGPRGEDHRREDHRREDRWVEEHRGDEHRGDEHRGRDHRREEPRWDAPRREEYFRDHDIARFREHDFDRWRGGRWEHGWHEGRRGWWWVVGPVWYFYPQPVYPFPDPYLPPVVAAPPPQPSYYYCPNPQGYYPYVQQCLTGWRVVPAR